MLNNKQLTRIFNSLPTEQQHTAAFEIDLDFAKYRYRVEAMMIGSGYGGVAMYRLVRLHDEDSPRIIRDWSEDGFFSFNRTQWTSDQGYLRANLVGGELTLTRYAPQVISSVPSEANVY